MEPPQLNVVRYSAMARQEASTKGEGDGLSFSQSGRWKSEPVCVEVAASYRVMGNPDEGNLPMHLEDAQGGSSVRG